MRRRGGEELSNPALSLVCTGATEDGGWQADSTYRMHDTLPARTFSEGVLHLLIPGDGQFGEPVPECAGPAWVSARSFNLIIFDGDEPVEAFFAVPEDVFGELNTAAAAFNTSKGLE